MSDPDTPTESEPIQAGLITRRMAAERGRAASFLQIALGVVWLLLGVMNAFNVRDDGWYWVKLVLYVVLGAGSVILSFGQLRARAKRIAAFDAQYGVEAGRQ